MAQYGIIIGLITLLIIVVSAVGYSAGKSSTYTNVYAARQEGYNEGLATARKSQHDIGKYNKSVDEAYVDGFKCGFTDARKAFYEDPMTEKRAEDDRIRKEIADENQGTPIAAELLMAYGVTKVSQLPKSVRQQYNITTDDSIDLDAILTKEVETDGRY